LYRRISEHGHPRHPRKRGHSRAHDLVSSLTQQILLGTFKPGDRLPSENTLVREHGISRTVVREALSKLQASAWWSRATASVPSSSNARPRPACG
jgi:DNA-binding FadR family transcriptional regulator